jgi:ferritin-like metal-binding protein YciE
MTELDGTWRVQRVSGFLPPLMGLQKRISGERGETTVGTLPGVPFTVEGLTLRYRPPLDGFVDQLEPAADGFSGRSTFRGREYARFTMRRVQARTTTTEGVPMADTLEAQLVKHIDEALAMEKNVLRMLDSMIATTADVEIKEELRRHKLETETQSDRLIARLEAHGATPSMVREAGGVLGALMKSVVDVGRSEKAGRNARDGYATEHMEIAAYQLLERVAKQAGDEETAEVARQNRAEEEAMAKKLDAHWDRFAELSLEEAGVGAGAGRRDT